VREPIKLYAPPKFVFLEERVRLPLTQCAVLDVYTHCHGAAMILSSLCAGAIRRRIPAMPIGAHMDFDDLVSRIDELLQENVGSPSDILRSRRTQAPLSPSQSVS
jgi:hypothetical protein